MRDTVDFRRQHDGPVAHVKSALHGEEAVRLLQTSGRRQRQIAGDLGISVSALGRWVTELREEDLLSGPHEDAAKEITRLRRERDLARQERDLLFARESR